MNKELEYWHTYIMQNVKITKEDELHFINLLDENNYIYDLVDKNNIPCAQYLLVMYDHICSKYEIPLNRKYDNVRKIEVPGYVIANIIKTIFRTNN